MNIKHLGVQPYDLIWQEMKQFTAQRTKQTVDELWFLEHYPVYTQGQAGKAEHIIQQSSIPVVQSDRGGQVTYHGPGQLVVYVLMDIARRKLGIRTLVRSLEQIIMNTLQRHQIQASTRCGAPGVYVGENKIASIGLRVKNGCTYHGIALNIDMDLNPFSNINPCGIEKMQMTQISSFNPQVQLEEVSQQLIQEFLLVFPLEK